MKYAYAAVMVLILTGIVAQPAGSCAPTPLAGGTASDFPQTVSGVEKNEISVARNAVAETSEQSVTQPAGVAENQNGVARAGAEADSARGGEKPAAAAPKAYVPVTRFDPSRNALQDIGLAITEAGRSNRRVLLDVGGEWCIWCRRMDSTFAKNRDLGALLHEKFVVVKVNYSKENKNEEALGRLPKIPGYPHLFVLSEEGLLLHSQDTAELESGKGYDVEKLRTFILQWGHP